MGSRRSRRGRAPVDTSFYSEPSEATGQFSPSASSSVLSASVSSMLSFVSRSPAIPDQDVFDCADNEQDCEVDRKDHDRAGSGAGGVGGGEVFRDVPSPAASNEVFLSHDFTSLPIHLDDMFSKFDADGSLRAVSLSTSDSWTLRRRETLLTDPET